MLLCGFEKFRNYYVRIDILERLFLLIFNASKNGEKEVKIIPEMLNLLGCTKDNFVKLLKEMNYKVFEKDKDVFFKYIPQKKKFNKENIKKDLSDNPFGVLNQLDLK